MNNELTPSNLQLPNYVELGEPAYEKAIKALQPAESHVNQLQQQVKGGNVQAMGLLIKASLVPAYEFAKEFEHRGVPFPQILDCATDALCKAAPYYMTAEAMPFFGFAVWWIRQACLDLIYDRLREWALTLIDQVTLLPAQQEGILLQNVAEGDGDALMKLHQHYLHLIPLVLKGGGDQKAYDAALYGGLAQQTLSHSIKTYLDREEFKWPNDASRFAAYLLVSIRDTIAHLF